MPIERPPITEQTILKFLAAGGVPPVGNRRFRWPLPQGDQPGDWATASRPIVPCQRGLHLTTLAEWHTLVSDELYVAEPAPKAVRHYEWEGVKFAVSKARLLWRVAHWTPRAARLLACECAERVLPLYEQPFPGDERPRRAIAAARRFANGQIDTGTLREAYLDARKAYDERAAVYYSKNRAMRKASEDKDMLAALHAAQAAFNCTIYQGIASYARDLREVLMEARVAVGAAHLGRSSLEAKRAEQEHHTARFLAVLNGEPL